MNKLPKMYHNKIDKKISNNEKSFSTLNINKNMLEKNTKKDSNLTIYQKLNKIFKSPKYIYKIDVIIVIDGINYKKRIIGRNNNKIITIENEIIDIDKIDDIYIDD